jgi:hypothetical protein
VKTRQIILSVIIVCLLIAVAWGFYLYNKPHTSAEGKSTDATLSADSLYNAFTKNEAAANKVFMNKILEINGTVQDITMSNRRPVVLLNTGQVGSINCEMAIDSAKVFSTLHKAAQVTIKGKCSGYLMDVNLVDCVIK